MLRDHVEKGDPVDVANFAMMLSQRGEGIAQPAPTLAASTMDWQDEGCTSCALKNCQNT